MNTPVTQRHEDTIAAIATGIGGSIAIVRISGSQALQMAGKIWKARSARVDLPPRTLVLGCLYNAEGQTEDHCMAVYMPGPHSYTGEDVVEIQCHGGRMAAATCLAAVIKQGARHADPGEFSKRAFINGRIDLTQAEAVLDIINAQSTLALHAANRQLDGALSRRVNHIYEMLREALAESEVRMDFVEEDLAWSSVEQLRQQFAAAASAVEELLKLRREGEILRYGIRLVIAGLPNAGKSSLMNLILGRDRAIVTHLPGTTRDTIEESVHIRGLPVTLTDTAGLRETNDLIEERGIERSRASIQSGQIILWVVDATQPMSGQCPRGHELSGDNVILILNKIDLAPQSNGPAGFDPVKICAITGEGLSILLDRIENRVWQIPHHEEPEFAISIRHASLLEEAVNSLAGIGELLEEQHYELLAVNLRNALDALGKITGKTVEADILENIFAKFCIGK